MALAPISGAKVRGGTYYLNIAIPPAIRHLHEGRALLTGTLKTADPKKAKKGVTTARAGLIKQSQEVEQQGDLKTRLAALTPQQRALYDEAGDFALMIDGKLSVLIEVKPITMSLGSAQYSQLYRYFAVKEAKLAVLTNGREIWFFSDMDDANKMDKKPFFTFDLQSYAEAEVGDLARFQKQNFSVGAIREAASNLRFAKAAAAYLKKQLEAPDDDFVKLVGRQIFEGNLTKASVEPLKTAIKAALEFLIRERIQDKLSVAFPTEPLPVDPKTVKQDVVGEAASDVVTTEEEMQAFMIVRAIAARVVDVDRITLRDAKSYCSIFVDDNNRKPVCRLYFNAKSVKAVGLFDAQKTETKQTIERLSDIYKFSKEIEDAVKAHAGGDGGM